MAILDQGQLPAMSIKQVAMLPLPPPDPGMSMKSLGQRAVKYAMLREKEALEELHLPSDDDQASMLSSASGPELPPGLHAVQATLTGP